MHSPNDGHAAELEATIAAEAGRRGSCGRGLTHSAHPVAAAVQKQGLLVRAVGGDMVAICPPLIITEDEIANLFDRLAALFDRLAAALRALD
jgi:4-aminobutyrate--pyruvate transaminase